MILFIQKIFLKRQNYYFRKKISVFQVKRCGERAFTVKGEGNEIWGVMEIFC